MLRNPPPPFCSCTIPLSRFHISVEGGSQSCSIRIMPWLRVLANYSFGREGPLVHSQLRYSAWQDSMPLARSKVDSSEINYCILRHFIVCDANSFAAKRHTHAIWCPNYHCRQGDHSTLMNLCTLPISGKTFGPLKRSISSQRRS